MLTKIWLVFERKYCLSQFVDFDAKNEPVAYLPEHIDDSPEKFPELKAT
jgi:hypothetical protein